MLDAPKTRIALLCFGALGVLATLLPLIPTNEWWIRGFDFPRVLIATVLGVLFAAFVLVYRRERALDSVFLVLCGACAIYQAVRMAPFTLVSAPSVAPSESCGDDGFRVMTANVLQTNRSSDAFIDLVRESSPDLLLVVETDEWWEDELAVIEDDYPFVLRKPMENTYGMLLYSKLPLSSEAIRFLVEDDVPSIRATVTLRSGATIEFYGVHPRPPNPEQDSDARDGELILIAREVADSNRPSVVAGDLNDVAWSDTTHLFEEVGGLLDPREGRGLYSTFHAHYWIFRWPLDHVFVTRSFRLVNMEVLPKFESDHMPIQLDLCYVPRGNEQPDAPSAGESEEADEAIREARDGEE